MAVLAEVYTHRPAALFEPASDVVPHVIRFKGVEQEVGCFNQFGCLLILSEFTETQCKILNDVIWLNEC